VERGVDRAAAKSASLRLGAGAVTGPARSTRQVELECLSSPGQRTCFDLVKQCTCRECLQILSSLLRERVVLQHRRVVVELVGLARPMLEAGIAVAREAGASALRAQMRVRLETRCQARPNACKPGGSVGVSAAWVTRLSRESSILGAALHPYTSRESRLPGLLWSRCTCYEHLESTRLRHGSCEIDAAAQGAAVSDRTDVRSARAAVA
jgi:hypothetical protein